MDDEKKTASTTPPYVPYRTLKNVLRSVGQVMPSRIDKSVMPSFSGGVQAQVIHALKYLGLIHPDGSPTQKLAPLVKSDGPEYQKQLREVLLASYPFFVKNSLDLQTATSQQINEEFSRLASGDTVRKCITFFVPAAIDAGFQISPYIKQPGKRSPSTGKTKRVARAPAVKGTATGTQPQPQQPAATPAAPAPMPWHEMLLSKFPSFDPSWPDEVKAKWFDGFNDLMERGQPKGGPS